LAESAPSPSPTGLSAGSTAKGKLLEFKVFEKTGRRCQCPYCAPFLSGSDDCNCPTSPCDHDRYPKGVLVVKSDDVNSEVIESIKKQFNEAVGKWKKPVIGKSKVKKAVKAAVAKKFNRKGKNK
jgi:hypothetical protein